MFLKLAREWFENNIDKENNHEVGAGSSRNLTQPQYRSSRPVCPIHGPLCASVDCDAATKGVCPIHGPLCACVDCK